MIKKAVRYVLGTACLFLALWFLVPLCYQLFHISMMYPALYFLLLASLFFFPEKYGILRNRHRKLWISACMILAAGTLFCTVLLGMMFCHCLPSSTEEEDATVIVLGCRINDDQPSPILQNRINAAYDYLSTHPDAVCIASGGQADDEIMTEAHCIALTLEKMGISEGRIYEEGASVNTYGNLTGSARIIAEENLSTQVWIASDNYHQYRASLFAEKNGLTPHALSCQTYWPLAPGYWAREMLAVCAAYLLY